MQETICGIIDDYYSDRDVWLLSSPISRDLYIEVSDKLENLNNKKDKCTLFLTTGGGDPDAAFRIARAFKHHYPNENSFRIVICGFCKSAGTLIAIGADELAIGDMGELGPLDVQVNKSDEFSERVSGLEIKESLESIHKHAHEIFRSCLVDIKLGTRVSMKMAGEFASLLATGMVNPLYAQIDPNRIGELNRAMKIAEKYGEQLDEKTKNLKDASSLNAIISGYPSHSFVIDRKEATKLFNRVMNLSEVENIIFQLFKFNGLIFPFPKNADIQFLNLQKTIVFDVMKDRLQSQDTNGSGKNEHSDVVNSESEIAQGAGKVSEEKDGQADENSSNNESRKSKAKPASKAK